MRSHGPSRVQRWALVALVLAVVAGHGVVLRYAWPRLGLSAAALAGVVVLVLIKHLGLAGAVRRMWRRSRR